MAPVSSRAIHGTWFVTPGTEELSPSFGDRSCPIARGAGKLVPGRTDLLGWDKREKGEES